MDKPCYEAAKRAFDLLAAAVGLALCAPAMVLLYLLVRLTSRGPGFFVQDRAGRNGRIFRMVKFRTMRAEHAHDPDPAVVIAADHDSVTPVGRFLRRFHLDELPQLVHVLSGRMSLVGPRPTVPEQVAAYGDFQRRRLTVRPGVTGLAQVNGGTGLTWDERIEWDVYYVERRSLALDLWILLRTFAGALCPSVNRPRRFGEVHPDVDLRR